MLKQRQRANASCASKSNFTQLDIILEMEQIESKYNMKLYQDKVMEQMKRIHKGIYFTIGDILTTSKF